MKKYIGKTIIGFKFETKKGHNVIWVDDLTANMGIEGRIEDYDEETDSFDVSFVRDNSLYFYSYPASICARQIDMSELSNSESYVDEVNNPSHYKLKNGIEVIDVIESANLGFHLANVVKYVLRAGKKDKSKELQDLKKAQFYLNRKIENAEKDN